MTYGLAITAHGFAVDEVTCFMECLQRVNSDLPDLFVDYMKPPEVMTFRLVRDQYERAVRSFMGLLYLMDGDVFEQIGSPVRLAPLFGHTPPASAAGRYHRWIYEPATGLRWPTANMLAFDLGVTYNSVYFHLRPNQRSKSVLGRQFKYLIPRS